MHNCTHKDEVRTSIKFIAALQTSKSAAVHYLSYSTLLVKAEIHHTLLSHILTGRAARTFNKNGCSTVQLFNPTHTHSPIQPIEYFVAQFLTINFCSSGFAVYLIPNKFKVGCHGLVQLGSLVNYTSPFSVYRVAWLCTSPVITVSHATKHQSLNLEKRVIAPKISMWQVTRFVGLFLSNWNITITH